MLNQDSSSHQGERVGKVIKTNKRSIFIKLNKSIHRLDGIRLNDKRQYGFQIGTMFVNSVLKDIASKGEIIEIKNIDNASSFINVDVIRTSDYRLLKDIENKLKQNIKVEVKGKLYCYKNRPLDLEIRYKDIVFHEKGDIVQESLSNGTSKERIVSQLQKSKDFNFVINNITLQGDEDIFIPISSANVYRTTVAILPNTRE